MSFFRTSKAALRLATASGRYVRASAQNPPAVRTRSFHSSSALGSMGLPQHLDEDGNHGDEAFEFTAESQKEIDVILAKYPSNYKKSGIIPLLYVAQEQCGNWVPLTAMNKIAEIVGVHPMRVYEVASFYTMFNRRKVGQFHLQLCCTTPCMLRGAYDIGATIQEHLGIEMGGTTADGSFTLSEVECLGACVNAPMLQVNNKEFYEDLTPENTIALLESLKAGKAKAGPQIDRQDCEGVLGLTSLKGKVAPPPVRDFTALKKAWDAEQAAKAEKAAKA